VSAATIVLVASAAGLMLACASEASVTVGVNAACTRTKDCQAGLACTGGVCMPEDSGAEGGLDGAALADAGAGADAGQD
jgi:hypothetical protein